MKAVIWTRYGPPEVLQLREVEKPTPKDNEVLIKVQAATVTAGDCEARSLKLAGLFALSIRLYVGIRRPTRVTILGQELAGEIEAAGSSVTKFKAGDAVFAPTFLRFGAYAEYACVPETYAAPKPANLTYEEAATIPTGGVNGLHFLRAANIQAGERVLIYGAGGSIGTYAIQIAKAWGAEVTGVDSADKLEMLRSIGADRVIDYKREDFTKSGQTYDVIIDVVGKSPYWGSIRSLRPNGRYILGNASLFGMFMGPWTSKMTDKKVITAVASYKPDDYALLTGLIEAGKVKPFIDRRYPLAQTAEAHRYVGAGYKKGNIVITVGQNSKP